jgi:hypothetical protein
MFTVNGTEARQERARAKAYATRPAVQVINYNSFSVEGSGGEYDVTFAAGADSLEAGCNCMAGQNDKPCYHVFAALRLRETLTVTAVTIPAPRDKNLATLERDLQFIARRADGITSDFDIMDDILRAVRSARLALGEYEISLMPEVIAEAA